MVYRQGYSRAETLCEFVLATAKQASREPVQLESESTGQSNVERSCMWPMREQAVAATDCKPVATPMKTALPLVCYWIKAQRPCAGGLEIQ